MYKFRGKRLDNGEWVEGDVYQPNTNDPLRHRYGEVYIHSHKDGGMYQVDPASVGQYTGVLDRNGNEIYENMRVKAWSQGMCCTCTVKWRGDRGGTPCWILYPAWQEQRVWSISATREENGLVYDRGIEIIDDNPELLKVGVDGAL